MFKKPKLDSTSSKLPERKPENENNRKMSKSPEEMKSRFPGGEFLPIPIKSDSDSKDYQVIKLSNGLIATLVSDKKHLIELGTHDEEESNPESVSADNRDDADSQSGSESESEYEKEEKKEKLAACCLSVEVGSFSDPDQIQGLSHFLEHMVFMGSEKYPKENEFDAFIKRHGGSDNAFTECEYTTYYFECPEQHLLKAMDIFSQFFTAPLLKSEAIDREREAIESEFQEAFPNDSHRKDQLLSSFASPHNPARKFTWGNQYTLKDNVNDEHLYNAVQEYRKRHYSADRMKLAVQGRLTLDQLREWTVECFSSVPRVPNQADKFNSEGHSHPLFDMEKFHRFYYVEPVRDMTEIELRWVLPSALRLYKTKPLKYLAFIIGHEGKGSLLSHLKRNLWALELRAGCAEDGLNTNELYTIFTISIVLTDTGSRALEDVLRATFSYLKMLKQSPPNKRIFDEIQSLSDIGFRFQEESPAVDTVESISQSMLLLPPTEYLRGDELMFEYDPQEIDRFLQGLTPTAVNIMYMRKPHSVQLDQEEFWFKTKFKSEPIPEKWTNNWENVEVFPEFHLPEKNRYIPTDFAIIDLHDAKIPKYPRKIRNNELVEIWYREDDIFKLPIASVDLLIITPYLIESAETSVILDLFVKILHHNLAEELYHASAADLEYSIAVRSGGLHIGVYGYNQRLNLLVDLIAQGIKDFDNAVQENVFEAYKTLHKRMYFNATLKTENLAKEIRLGSYTDPYYSSAEKYRHLKNVDLEKFKNCVKKLFGEVHYQALVQGNINSKDGEEIVDSFIETTAPPNREVLAVERFPRQRTKIIPRGEKCVRVESFNMDDRNCVTTIYFQLGPGTIKQHAALELFVLMMDEPLFDTLRTQQQLGYDVSTTVRESDGILGISAMVRSQISKHTVDHVKERMDEFVLGFVTSFRDTPDDVFEDAQESLINIKSHVDTYLKEETKRNFEEIQNQEFVFNRLEKEIDSIAQLDKYQVADLVTSFIAPEDSEPRKLVVQVVGHREDVQSNLVPTDDKEEKIAPASDDSTLPEDIVYKFLRSDDFPAEYFVSDISEWNGSLPEYPPHKLVE
ncbi:nardilysin [Nesidiocoris tenuis]|uniref:Nardilysin n=2 Tax=Nesidiocoris tenuis TaxID=355587 RepID=A0ABN7AMF5_9HEMI|nr:nardilysin [Nesidiocoris tenuis]